MKRLRKNETVTSPAYNEPYFKRPIRSSSHGGYLFWRNYSLPWLDDWNERLEVSACTYAGIEKRMYPIVREGFYEFRDKGPGVYTYHSFSNAIAVDKWGPGLVLGIPEGSEEFYNPRQRQLIEKMSTLDGAGQLKFYQQVTGADNSLKKRQPFSKLAYRYAWKRDDGSLYEMQCYDFEHVLERLLETPNGFCIPDDARSLYSLQELELLDAFQGKLLEEYAAYEQARSQLEPVDIPAILFAMTPDERDALQKKLKEKWHNLEVSRHSENWSSYAHMYGYDFVDPAVDGAFNSHLESDIYEAMMRNEDRTKPWDYSEEEVLEWLRLAAPSMSAETRKRIDELLSTLPGEEG